MAEKSTKEVIELIRNGIPPRLALDQCGFGDVTDETMERLNKIALETKNSLIKSLYDAANNPKENAASRAKCLEIWNKLCNESGKNNQNITIIIEGEDG